MFTKEKKEIAFRAIIEIMGRPPEFLTETLTKTVESIEKEGKMKIISKQIFEPKEMDDQKGLFTAFAEVELSTLGMESIFEFIFHYAPSNIEVISPAELNFPAQDANIILNLFIEKNHKMDAVNRMLSMENTMLKKKLGTMTPEEIQQLDLKRDEIMKQRIEEAKKQQEKAKENSEKPKKSEKKKSKKK